MPDMHGNPSTDPRDRAGDAVDALAALLRLAEDASAVSRRADRFEAFGPRDLVAWLRPIHAELSASVGELSDWRPRDWSPAEG